ncbi:hypothetical protein [Scleromatobacter humisilvae]|uniref:Uncharacterized protein n=1 Tax=Scleromatobacter humisilvae TaxID=2897159 RepID=A0A9X1YHL5_9BURK|nr:hypothetical protein [Scleromatobacter humisilvae]MCK9685030.1 hypothetical protein [Scleromatobacter humisilvae]
MNAITKLAAVALGAMSIAGGVAVAQSTSPDDGRAATANYGTPPGAPLKRDGSLRADPTPAPVTSAPMDTSSTTTTTTQSTTWNNPPAAAPVDAAPVAAAPAPAPDTSTAVTDTTPAPRADRN